MSRARGAPAVSGFDTIASRPAAPPPLWAPTTFPGHRRTFRYGADSQWVARFRRSNDRRKVPGRRWTTEDIARIEAEVAQMVYEIRRCFEW